MSGSRREWLIKLRKARGLSQEDLAGRIGVDGGTVGRWERGTQTMRVRKRATLADALGVSVRHLVDLAGEDVSRVEAPIDLRQPVAPARAFGVVADSAASPIDSLRSVIDGCRGLDHSVGPAGTLEIVRGQLVIADQLATARQSSADRRRLLSLTAQIHQLAGWMSFDTLDLTTARVSFEDARSSAEGAEDAAVLAYVLGPSAAFAEADAGDPNRALDLAYAAQGWARRAGNLRLLAFVHAIAARVHAKLGDDHLARLALDEAAQALAAHEGWETDPVWLQVFDETALLGHSGSVDLDLGRPEQAVELLDRQDASSAQIFVRNRAIWRLDRATAYRQMNELDQACDEVGQALDLVDTTSSPRTRHKLHRLTDSLTTGTRNSHSSAVLLERLKDQPTTARNDDQLSGDGESTGT